MPHPKPAMIPCIMTRPKLQIVSCVLFQASTNLNLGAARETLHNAGNMQLRDERKHDA